MEKITEKTTLSEILKNPKLVEILEKYNFPCMSCPFAKMEVENLEIGRVCQLYGIDAKKVVKDLNDVLKNEKRGN
jgi:hypothetical protein